MSRIAIRELRRPAELQQGFLRRKALLRLTNAAFFIAILFNIVIPFHASAQAQAGSGNGGPQAAVGSSRPGLDTNRIAQLAAELIEKRHVPGYSVGIVLGDDLVYARGFGVANRKARKPATPSTLYQIGSITKVFTATLLAALRDDGLVRLDDPVRNYLPPGRPFPRGPAGAPEPTLRHLATHTAGLPKDAVNRVNVDPPGGPGVMRAYSTRELYEGLERTELVRPVGTFLYSNLGFMVLGHVLERAAGLPYEQLLKRRILEPLGMRETSVELPPDRRERLATAYWPSFEPMVERDPWFFGEIAGGGGLTSSVSDLARFVSMQFRPDEGQAKPISRAAVRELWTPQPVEREDKAAIGLGWWLSDFGPSGRWVHHGGEVDGFSSFIAFKPEDEVGVIVLTNFGGDAASRLATALLPIALDPAKKR